MAQERTSTRRRGRRGQGAAKVMSAGLAGPAYHTVRNTLTSPEVFSEDAVEDIHATALRVLEELGVRVLNAEARDILVAAGCVLRDDMMVHFPRDLVSDRVAQAPREMVWHGGDGYRVEFDMRSLHFMAGGGCPNITDIDRGRRPGTLADFVDLTRLQAHFDTLPALSPSIEPQDVAVNERHLQTTRIQLETAGKVPWIFARGSGQVEDCFEMIRIARGLDEAAFKERIWTYTIINTNSPRQIDVPMAQGIMDFARAGQVSIITPFCLSGAMAPITEAGSLTLSHAEALAGITLAQVTNPGAPVMYGAFSSNVDMRSGAPVFGTPEHIRTNFGAGQLARHIGIPWRSATGTAANAPDFQSATETQLGLWGAVLGGANLIVHAAGWLEGGLTLSYEKFIMDLEACRTITAAMQPVEATPEAISFETIAEVAPGGHFFATEQTMARYADQFYTPLISDWRNFGQWQEAGAVETVDRAQAHWRAILDGFVADGLPEDRREALLDFVERRCAEGGAHPVD